jgi:hypothetical protein
LQICQQEQVDLLFPTVDTELPLYSVALKQFKEIGTDIVISSLQQYTFSQVDGKPTNSSNDMVLRLPTHGCQAIGSYSTPLPFIH